MRTDSRLPALLTVLRVTAVILSFFHSITLPAQTLSLHADTTRMSVGDTVSVRMRLLDAGTTFPLTLSGTFFLSNPTVFFPEFFSDSTRDTTRYSQSLQRQNDSLYDFSIILKTPPLNPLIELHGEALAGNDSLCTIVFRSIRANDSPVTADTMIILSHSIGTPLPYIRFASLDIARPDPCEACAAIHFDYQIDKPSALTFIFYDALGRVLQQEEMNAVAGTAVYTLQPGRDFTAGVYALRLKTNSGEAVQRFVIVN